MFFSAAKCINEQRCNNIDFIKLPNGKEITFTTVKMLDYEAGVFIADRNNVKI
jgi:hypothetical protein